MPSPPTPPTPAGPTPSPARLQRLLTAMHPVCSHDLPNQIVALQSLLQLFQIDEAEQLSPQAREYLGRLQSIGAKTQVMTQYLRELARLERYVPQRARVTMTTLFDDLRADAQRLFTEPPWTWESCWQVDNFIGDHRLLQQGVGQLLRSLMLGKKHVAQVIDMQTSPRVQGPDQGPDQGVVWSITVSPTEAVAPASDPQFVERRLALALAQECLAIADIACQPLYTPMLGAVGFSLTIPNRSAHE